MIASAILDRLLAVCPHLDLVTFEDPKFDEAGDLVPRCSARLAPVEARGEEHVRAALGELRVDDVGILDS